jgi:hypothetical protein
MRRWVIRAIVCLLLGAITTVAVAWGCAVSAPLRFEFYDGYSLKDATVLDWNWRGGFVRRRLGDRAEIQLDRRNFPASMNSLNSPHFPSQSEMETARIGIVTSLEPASDRLELLLNRWDLPLGTFAVEEYRGWPARSFWGSALCVPGARATVTDTYGCTLIDEPILQSGGKPQLLPFLPIWPGFVIDTLFYAAIWFGLFFGFASAKRGLRRARGRCPMCGYDLRSNFAAGCSECGWNREGSAA